MVKQHPATNLLDFEKAKINGQVLTSLDEARLRNTQLRKARKTYLNTLTLSDREPLWNKGPRGDRGTNWRDAGRIKSRILRWNEQIGVTFLNRITGGAKDGYKPWRASAYLSVLQRHGTRDLGLTLFRHFCIRGPIVVGIIWTGFCWFAYYQAWFHYQNFHGLVPAYRVQPAECLPEDSKLVARMCDTYPIRNNRAAKLKPDRKEFPLGTRYDWIEGVPVLPNDPNYHWVDGRPIRKDRGYFHPGPAGSNGKQAYEEDDFFDSNGFPRKPSLGMPDHGHGHH